MSGRSAVGSVVAILAVLALLFGHAALAQAKGHRGGGNKQKSEAAAKQKAAERAANAARQSEAEANMDKADAKQRLASANQKLKGTKAGIDEAGEEVEKAVQALKDVEKKIEDAQPADSPFARAREALRRAETEYQEARDRVLKSPEYQAKLAAAAGSTDPDQSPAMLRKRALESDADAERTLSVLGEAKAQYAKVRAELLGKSTQWVDASQAVREAKKNQAEVTNKVGAEVLHKRVASRDLKKAGTAAAVAAAAAKRSEARAKSKPSKKDKKN